MSDKKLIIWGILISAILIFGSYLIVFFSSEKPVQVASYNTGNKDRPRVEIKQSSADMGTIKVSDEKYADFVVKNVGNKPLQLSDISSSCGCTVGKIIYEGKESAEFGMHSQSGVVSEIAAGKSAVMRVIYRPYVMPVSGLVEREVYASTNDPENPKLIFKVTATVK